MSITQTQTLQEIRQSEYLNNDMLFKMLIIGDAGVGKSCLLLRYADDEFSDCYISTIGVDFKIRTVEMDGKVIKLNMWDTAGQERFKTITSSFYRGGHGVMIVFDLTDMESFSNVRSWVEEIEKYGGGHVAKLLVGNKSDVKNKRVISYETAQNLADELGMSYLETSARTSTNVEQAFMTMTACMKEKANRPDPDQTVPVGAGRSGSPLFAKVFECVSINEMVKYPLPKVT